MLWKDRSSRVFERDKHWHHKLAVTHPTNSGGRKDVMLCHVCRQICLFDVVLLRCLKFHFALDAGVFLRINVVIVCHHAVTVCDGAAVVAAVIVIVASIVFR